MTKIPFPFTLKVYNEIKSPDYDEEIKKQIVRVNMLTCKTFKSLPNTDVPIECNFAKFGYVFSYC